jgi:hypothetical protein
LVMLKFLEIQDLVKCYGFLFCEQYPRNFYYDYFQL